MPHWGPFLKLEERSYETYVQAMTLSSSIDRSWSLKTETDGTLGVVGSGGYPPLHLPHLPHLPHNRPKGAIMDGGWTVFLFYGPVYTIATNGGVGSRGTEAVEQTKADASSSAALSPCLPCTACPAMPCPALPSLVLVLGPLLMRPAYSQLAWWRKWR